MSSIAPGHGKSDDRVGKVVALLAAWRRVAGGTMARRCRPLRLEGGTLILEVTSPQWAAEIDASRDLLLASLKEDGVGVRRIRCVVAGRAPKIDAVEQPAQRAAGRPGARPMPDHPVAEGGEVSTGERRSLRSRMEAIAARYLEASSRRRDH